MCRRKSTLSAESAAVRSCHVFEQRPVGGGVGYFFEVKNVLDKTYIASANNITDSINPATGLQNPGSSLAGTGTGSIYAGTPRTFVAGMRLAFR
jgi:hypothetical protein